jgi:hypothetical protein
MRRVMKALGDAAYDAPSWWRAQREAKGIASADITDDDRERWLEEQAQDYADRLSKAFGSKLPGNPEVAARALAIQSPLGSGRWSRMARARFCKRLPKWHIGVAEAWKIGGDDMEAVGEKRAMPFTFSTMVRTASPQSSRRTATLTRRA